MTNEAIPVLDSEQVADLVALDNGQGAVFAKFVGLFVAGTPLRIAKLRDHSKSADLHALAETAHSLRGASGNLGALRLCGLLEKIETAARAGDLGAATTLIASLDAEYGLTQAALMAASPES